jgi:hypothetical protein
MVAFDTPDRLRITQLMAVHEVLRLLLVLPQAGSSGEFIEFHYELKLRMFWNRGVPGIFINAAKPENNGRMIEATIALRFIWIALASVGCIFSLP